MKTVILLIDFRGHPALGGEYLNNLRYKEVQKILTHPLIDKSKIVFCSTSDSRPDPKMDEIQFMASQLGFHFLTYEEHISFPMLRVQLRLKCGFDMDPVDTQIVVGGCNTGGCVTKASKLMNAVQAHNAGYQTTMYLPMCAEYEQPGINDTERQIAGLVESYKILKKYNAFKIKWENKFKYLDLPYLESAKEFDKR